jgi:glutamate/tyrosine decarboxylase-like PLP-dependent enzyme
METEVIRMTAELFGIQKDAYGVLTNGSSEAASLAILSYRNKALQTKNITTPNM